jgi:tRNA threonylcarbamoyladenosine biosynthesis protein TsaB
MTILTIRTDKPEAEIGLYADQEQIAYDIWQAHRALAETLHSRIQSLLLAQNLSVQDLQGIVCYKGPGSFTGLRIGLTVANALANAVRLPIVGETSDDWQQNGILRLLRGEDEKIVLPEYGADVHITTPKAPPHSNS